MGVANVIYTTNTVLVSIKGDISIRYDGTNYGIASDLATIINCTKVWRGCEFPCDQTVGQGKYAITIS